MAEGADRSSKTEQPTEKKIRDTVEKGNLPVSREAPILGSLFAALAWAALPWLLAPRWWPACCCSSPTAR